jgi:DNA-binding transcriptional MocR family regulator
MRLKLTTSLSPPGLNQSVIARFLKSGSYDRHLRTLRNHLKNQMSNTALAIARYFPEGTKINAPRGGLLLWLELNEGVDGLKLYQEAIKQNISILPGEICSASDKYKNCIRISCGYNWDERVEKGIMTLGKIISGTQKDE